MLAMVTDYVEAKTHYKYNAAEQITYVESLIKAVEALHNIGIIHGDIKPENVRINKETNDVKLIDFGSVYVTEDAQIPDEYADANANGITGGTEGYMAPEYKDYVTTALDMYSVGKTIEETLKYSNICPNMYTMIDMLTRTSPYERFGTKEAFRLLSTMRSEQSELEAAASMAVTNKGKLNAQQPVVSARQGNENEVFMSDLFDMFKQLKQDTAVLKKDNDTLKQHNEALNHKIDAMEKVTENN
ncbi:kinase-like domain-containing protein [Syncephalis fuscata]|nr:kinase-like domain-containing protein [Syncephalis fuscata]